MSSPVRARRFIPLLLLLSLSAEAKGKSGVRGLFYEATGKGAKSKVYLLGSIHIADKSVYPLPARVEEAFKNSRVLVVEVNIASSDQGAMAKASTMAIYPPGKTLKTQLPAPYYAE